MRRDISPAQKSPSRADGSCDGLSRLRSRIVQCIGPNDKGSSIVFYQNRKSNLERMTYKNQSDYAQNHRSTVCGHRRCTEALHPAQTLHQSRDRRLRRGARRVQPDVCGHAQEPHSRRESLQQRETAPRIPGSVGAHGRMGQGMGQRPPVVVRFSVSPRKKRVQEKARRSGNVREQFL